MSRHRNVVFTFLHFPLKQSQQSWQRSPFCQWVDVIDNDDGVYSSGLCFIRFFSSWYYVESRMSSSSPCMPHVSGRNATTTILFIPVFCLNTSAALILPTSAKKHDRKKFSDKNIYFLRRIRNVLQLHHVHGGLFRSTNRCGAQLSS